VPDRAHFRFVAISLLVNSVPVLAQSCAPGELRVAVVDSQESSVLAASVRVSSGNSIFGELSTQAAGVADFKGVPCGMWTVSVSREGFENAAKTTQVAGGSNLELRFILTPKMLTTSVDVSETPPPVEQSASENNELRPTEVKELPTNPATINDTLPLVPGIVRTADGELKIDGTGQERSAMVVNQTDITDPATGKFGQTLPVDSIETVNVLNTPFLAQYGRFTQSVIAVETRRGGEKWHAELNDPFPDFRIRSYHMRGIRNETPRFLLGGPLIRGRVYFISALQYFLNKAPSRTLPFPHNESKQESINSFTQFNYMVSAAQELTATLHLSPQHTNFVNPDYFTPQPTAPSYAQHDYFGTLADHLGVLDGLLDSSISVQRFDATVGAQGSAEMIIAPQGKQGNFFGTQNRSARRLEWLESWSVVPFNLLGTHLIKMGSSFTNLGNQGSFSYRPVDILDAAGRLEERIDFTNQSPFNRSDREVTGYLQDHWSLNSRLSFDYGARVEHQRLALSLRIALRAGFAWVPFADQRTVIRGGYGDFYDHLPLDIYTFGRYPLRTLTFYAPDGSVVGDPTPFINVIGSVTGPRSFLVRGQPVAGAFSPRGSTFNAQIEHSFSQLLRVRTVFTDARSVGLVVLEHGVLDSRNVIVMNGDGKSHYRQLELTAKFSWKEGQQINLSYTRSRSEGSLNTFDTFLGNFPTLLVRPEVYTNLPADIPNRFLLWGRVKTHFWGLEALPIIEHRSGFPYARLDATQSYVGVPYSDSSRFPHFFSADTRFNKDFKFRSKYTLRLSLTAFNITNHFNALAVHANVDDPQYGIFFGNYHRRYRGDFEVIF
jgi:hypothetical protein